MFVVKEVLTYAMNSIGIVFSNQLILYEVFKFLSSNEIFKVGLSFKFCYQLYLNDSLWQNILLDRKVDVSNLTDQQATLSLMRDSIRTPTWRELYYVLKCSSCSLVGVFSIERHPSGGLARIITRIVNNELYLYFEEYDAQGCLTNESRMYYDQSNHKLALRYDNNILILNDSESNNILSFAKSTQPSLAVFKLMPLTKVNETIKDIYDTHLLPCQGLFKSAYGSHGMELLQLRLMTRQDSHRPDWVVKPHYMPGWLSLNLSLCLYI